MIKFLNASLEIKLAEQIMSIVVRNITVQNALFLKKNLKEHERLLNQIERSIKSFNTKNVSNFYKRAKLGNKLKWLMLDNGYNHDYADLLTKWVMLKMQEKK